MQKSSQEKRRTQMNDIIKNTMKETRQSAKPRANCRSLISIIHLFPIASYNEIQLVIEDYVKKSSLFSHRLENYYSNRQTLSREFLVSLSDHRQTQGR